MRRNWSLNNGCHWAPPPCDGIEIQWRSGNPPPAPRRRDSLSAAECLCPEHVRTRRDGRNVSSGRARSKVDSRRRVCARRPMAYSTRRPRRSDGQKPPQMCSNTGFARPRRPGVTGPHETTWGKLGRFVLTRLHSNQIPTALERFYTPLRRFWAPTKLRLLECVTAHYEGFWCPDRARSMRQGARIDGARAVTTRGRCARRTRRHASSRRTRTGAPKMHRQPRLARLLGRGPRPEPRDAAARRLVMVQARGRSVWAVDFSL